MYWVQMQGLWALRPIVDLDSSCARTDTGWPESLARSTVDLDCRTETNQQSLAQSAGAACSAAALTAFTPSAVEGGTRQARLAVRAQGVIGARDSYHAQLAPSHDEHEQRQDGAATARAHPQAQTPRPPPPPPPHEQPQGTSQGLTEQQNQGWPEWFLQWAHRVKEGPDQGSPGPSAPPSAPTTPPSPPGTPQRSTVKSGLTHGPTLTAPEATPLAQGEPLRWP